MSTIPLGDYVGYCFTEAVKAREIADGYSRRVAEHKSGQPGLREFSTPRFRIAKLELTIPMVVDEAKFQRVARFVMDRDEFLRIVLARAGQAGARAEQELGSPDPVEPRPDPGIDSPAGRAAIGFYDRLLSNPEPVRPDDIVRIGWSDVFDRALLEVPLLREHHGSEPIRRLLAQTTCDVIDLVRARTVLDRFEFEQLLVTPLTQVVRDVGDASAVLRVKAELVEEGFYLRHAQDAESGTDLTMVEFE